MKILKYLLFVSVLIQAQAVFSQTKPKNCDCATGYGIARGDCRSFCYGGASYVDSISSEKTERSPSSLKSIDDDE